MNTVITLSNGVADIAPEASGIVIPALRYDHHEYVPGHGLTSVDEWGAYLINQDGGITIPAGLVPRCVAILRQQGWPVTVVDQTMYAFLRLSDKRYVSLSDVAARQAEFLAALDDPQDRELLAGVLSNPCGQILADTAQAPRITALIADLFVDSGVAVCCRNRAEARRVHAGIRRYSARPVALHPEQASDADMQNYFLVGAHSLGGFAQGDDFQVVIFVGFEQAISKQTIENVFDLNRDVSRYCLRDGRHQPSRGQQLRLEAICGPVLNPQPTEPDSRPGFEVVTVEFNHAIRPGWEDPFQLKRDVIWRNERRNAFIAGLARRAVMGKLDNMPMQTESGTTGLGVTVLVESPEHGAELQRHLADWQLLSVGSGWCSPAEPASDRTIATHAAVHAHGITADVVIRADGSTGWPLSDTGLWRTESRSGLVVELDDRPRQIFRKLQRRVQPNTQ